ncbi:class II aldolase/adducin family protein [Chloroflexota bacterium]
MSKWIEEKRIVLEASQYLLTKGLVGGASGNVSIRLVPDNGRDLLAITPHGRYYDLLTVDDIQVIDFEVEPVEGDLAPSVETMLHIGVYKERKNINAVIHTHSVFASVLSVAHLEIPPILDEQVVLIGEGVKLAKYGFPGSDELVENVIAGLGERNAVLLANHGMVGIGRTMRDALTVCELVETMAKVYFCARTLGGVNPLPSEAVETEKSFFNLLQRDDEVTEETEYL